MKSTLARRRENGDEDAGARENASLHGAGEYVRMTNTPLPKETLRCV